jgi:hypothetical protein
MKRPTFSAGGETITVRIPLTLGKRGGRKLVVMPTGPSGRRGRGSMIKALARAFRWRKMLCAGVHSTLEDLARAKGLAPFYVSGILRLPLLAGDRGGHPRRAAPGGAAAG